MKKKLKLISKDKVESIWYFQCPGCNQEHSINDRIWKFNNDLERPTFSPSYLMKGYRFADVERTKSEAFVCHSFITNGYIEYLNDCTHHLKGYTVELLEYENDKRQKGII